MNIEQLHAYALTLPHTELRPLKQQSCAVAVCGKWFLVTSQRPSFELANVKADPADVDLLIQNQPSLMPAWHMNKTHWLSARLDTTPDDLLIALVETSYKLVAPPLDAVL